MQTFSRCSPPPSGELGRSEQRCPSHGMRGGCPPPLSPALALSQWRLPSTCLVCSPPLWPVRVCLAPMCAQLPRRGCARECPAGEHLGATGGRSAAHRHQRHDERHHHSHQPRTRGIAHRYGSHVPNPGRGRDHQHADRPVLRIPDGLVHRRRARPRGSQLDLQRRGECLRRARLALPPARARPVQRPADAY